MSAEASPWTIGAVMSAAAVGVSWLLGIATAAWKARGVLASLDERMAKQTTDIKDEMRAEHDELSKIHGEAVAAVRQKIAETDTDMKEMALWNRDNFARQSDFKDAISSINRTFELLATEMRVGFREIGNKIDKMHGRE